MAINRHEYLTMDDITRAFEVMSKPTERPPVVLTEMDYNYLKEHWRLTDVQMEKRGYLKPTYIPMGYGD